MPGINITSFTNLSCLPCNGRKDCQCILQFKDSFIASDSLTWDCFPSIYLQPLNVVDKSYSVSLDFSLMLTFSASNTMRALPYQYNSDIIVLLPGLVEGTDYSLSPI